MAPAMLNIKVVPRRILSEAEAAEYVGLSAKRFKAHQPVAPVAMPGNLFRYDIRDLDDWLDRLKTGTADSDDDILGKLT